jgi:hypothetical protein
MTAQELVSRYRECFARQNAAEKAAEQAQTDAEALDAIAAEHGLDAIALIDEALKDED